MMEYFSNMLLTASSKYRQVIIGCFKLSYLLLGLMSVFGYVFGKTNEDLMVKMFGFGSLAGKAALITYVLTLLPGMFGRFGLQTSLIQILRIYRRYLGILMYSLAVTHVLLVKVLFVVTFSDLLPQGLFDLMGAIAFALLLSLFVTSNNYGVSRLKLTWFRLHRLTYVVMFFVFLHVALMQIGTSTVLMGGVILLQLVSFIVVYRRTGSLTGGKPY